jgi:hypothetical protein
MRVYAHKGDLSAFGGFSDTYYKDSGSDVYSMPMLVGTIKFAVLRSEDAAGREKQILRRYAPQNDNQPSLMLLRMTISFGGYFVFL